MKYSEQYIEKAIEGEWRPKGFEKGPCTCFQNPPCTNCESEDEHIYDYLADVSIEEILLDPRSWQAVGSVEGWNKLACNHCLKEVSQNGHYYECEEDGLMVEESYADYGWLLRKHRMIDALAEASKEPGFDMHKTIEEFIKTLLT